MKYITKYKSPNYDSRNNSKIKLIIIHYTAIKNTSEAINYLCQKEKKVSSHYLISQKGKIYILVNDKLRSWHAGLSFWQDITDINSISIGIELDYSPYGKNNKFSYKMITSLKRLILNLQKKYKINKKNILAHSDIAPFRKKDPGKHFPWKSLLSSNIILNFQNVKKSEVEIVEKWFFKNGIKSKKKIIILSLSIIGYDTYQISYKPKLYNKIIKVYKNRYNYIIYEKNFSVYDTLMKHLFKFILTKN